MYVHKTVWKLILSQNIGKLLNVVGEVVPCANGQYSVHVHVCHVWTFYSVIIYKILIKLTESTTISASGNALRLRRLNTAAC